MGDLAERDVAAAVDAMRSAAAATGGSWKVEWGAPGTFPAAGLPRVIWLGLADPAVTITVQGLLMAELKVRGLPADDRPFRPHLTVARVRGSLSRDRARAVARVARSLVPPPPAVVDALVLYQSTAVASGTAYRELARAALAG